MIISDRRNADDQLDLLAFAPVKTIRIGEDCNTGVENFTGHGFNAVRNSDVVSDGSIEYLFLFKHCLSIALCYIAAFFQQFTHCLDGFFFGFCRVIQHDVLLQKNSAVEVCSAFHFFICVDACVQEILNNLIILRSGHEVCNCDQLGIRSTFACTFRKILMADNHFCICRNFGYGRMFYLDLIKACSFEFLLQHSSTHCGASHACITCEYDVGQCAKIDLLSGFADRICAVALGLRLHILHLGLSFIQIASGVGETDDRSCNQEGNYGADYDRQQNHECGAARSHAYISEDGTRGCR